MTTTTLPTAARLLLLRLCSAYVRNTSSHRGKWRIANLAMRWSPVLKHLKRPLTVRVREGFLLTVDGRSQTGRIAFTTGDYEPRTTRIMQALLRTGYTAIDVGANIGFFSVVAARAVGPTGGVVAFEPAVSVRQCLAANLQLNGITNVRVQSEALSASCGDTALYLGPQEDSGLGSLRELSNSVTAPVKQIRFDDWWDRRSRVDLVKIDVEGAELLVLAGMTECLARDRPTIIVEVTDEYLRGLGASAEQLIKFLMARGYHMYAIVEAGPLIPIKHARDLSRCPSQFNALCTHTFIDADRLCGNRFA